MSSIKTLCNEVELLVQFPEVGLAIADSNVPVPGYLLGEINAVTYIDYGRNCKSLVNFLISRLEANTPFVCIKILKLLLHLVKNGHTEMVEEVKFHEIALKEAMGFHGPPDDLHGKTFYENIRKLARELLNFVFSENRDVIENTTPSGIPELAGYGSNANNKEFAGFGFSVKSEKSVSEKISDGVTKFFEEFLPAGQQILKEDKTSHLSKDLPKYKPLIINKSSSESNTYQDTLESGGVKRKVCARRTKPKTRAYKPGKPGGGWNDSDDEDSHDYEEETKKCTLSKGNSASFECLDLSKMEIKDNISDWVDEHKVVDVFAVNEPLYVLDYTYVSSLCKRCSSLNCDKILIFLLEKLEVKEELVQLRALVLIEYLIFQDIVPLESLVKIIDPPLANLYEKAKDVPSTVKIKARKICLIIQNLSKSAARPVTPELPKTPVKCST